MSMENESSKAVAQSRKQALLLEARRARVNWVDEAKSFLIHSTSAQNSNTATSAKIKSSISSFDTFSNSKTCSILTSLPNAAKALYKGLSNDEMEERISKQLSSQLSSSYDIMNITSVLMTDQHQEEEKTLTGNESSAQTVTSTIYNLKEMKEYQTQYEHLLLTLRSPESAELIQATKLFVQSLAHLDQNPEIKIPESSILSIFLNDDQGHEQRSASSSKKELELTRDLIHISKKLDAFCQKQNLNSNYFKVFVMQQCYNSVIHCKLIQHDVIMYYNTFFYNKLQQLQSLPCSYFLEDIPTATEDIQTKLQVPILWLQSMTHVISPYFKYQCIHSCYKSLIQSLPSSSADDFIPYFIYILICANPANLILHLYLAECFGTNEEAPTGEMSYAWTNLHAAIQYLFSMEVKTNNNLSSNTDSSTGNHVIKVSLEEYKKFVKIQEKHSDNRILINTKDDFKNKNEDNEEFVPLTVHMVRKARLNDQVLLPSTIPTETPTTTNGVPTQITTTTISSGASTSYSFLGKQFQDIKVQDIPLLLQEYHDLIYINEELLLWKKQKEDLDRKKFIELKRESLQLNLLNDGQFHSNENNKK